MDKRRAIRTFTWTCNLLVLASGVTSAMTFQSKTDICEPIQIPMCQHMPYNMTRMPNLLHHSSQENAILAIEQFQPLLEQNCSDVLLFFLCAMYAPICTVNFQSAPIPPCRSVCEKAREGCERIVNDHNISWPDYLDCTHLPRYDRGVCVSPEAIVSSTNGSQYTNRPELTTNNIRPVSQTERTYNSIHPVKVPPRRQICRCNKRKSRPKRKKYKQGKYDYVIRGKVEHQGIINNVNTVSIVRVLAVYKHNIVPIKTNTTIDLWTNSTCVCPKLMKRIEYLLIGYEDAATRRLLFLDTSLSTKWKPKWDKRLKKWTKVKSSRRNRRRCRKRRKKGKVCRKIKRKNRKKTSQINNDIRKMSKKQNKKFKKTRKNNKISGTSRQK